MNNESLIIKAASVIKSRKCKDFLIGDVGCALITEKGNIYLGTCADISSNTFCAEKAAVAAMVTSGESRIKKIVAVWKDERNNLFVIPPCGSCRELIRTVDNNNLDTEVVLDISKVATLRELLPYHDWWQKVEL